MDQDMMEEPHGHDEDDSATIPLADVECDGEKAHPGDDYEDDENVELRIAPGHNGSSCLFLVAKTNSKDRSQVLNVTPKQCKDVGIKMTPRDLLTEVMNLATVQYQLKFMITPVKDNPILPNLRDLLKIGLKRVIEGQSHLMASGSKSSGS